MLWPFIPTSVMETLTFRTDVRRTREGEFRDSLSDATQEFKLNYAAHDTDASPIEILYRARPYNLWHVPVWPDMELKNGLASGTTTINVETDTADYRAGGKACIIKSQTEFELVDVDSVGAGTITLSSATTVDFVGEVAVAPARAAYAPEGLQTGEGINITEFSIGFIVAEPVDLSADNYTNYGDYDLITDSPDATSELSGSLSQQIDWIANGFGAFQPAEFETYVRRRGTFSYTDVTRAERWARRELLHRLRGKDRPFWLPTFKRDMTIYEYRDPTFDSIRINPTFIEKDDLVGMHIMVEHTDGTYECHEVSGVIDGGDYLEVGFVGNLTSDVYPGALVCFVYLMRLDQDEIKLEHIRSCDGFVTSVSSSCVEVNG